MIEQNLYVFYFFAILCKASKASVVKLREDVRNGVRIRSDIDTHVYMKMGTKGSFYNGRQSPLSHLIFIIIRKSWVFSAECLPTKKKNHDLPLQFRILFRKDGLKHTISVANSKAVIFSAEQEEGMGNQRR